jgi:phosphoglycolate phosphatase (TIGR01487 family)
LAASRRRPGPGEVKAVAVDVDGTLADDSRRVGLDAVAALRRVQESGVPVMLASGNVLPIAYALSNYLGFKGPIIAENGGIVCHEQRIWVIGDSAKPRKAYEYLVTKMDAPRLFTDRWRETEVGLKREVSLEKVRELLKGWPVDVQTTGWAVHIMEKGMNKFHGVEKGCELLGIEPKDVAAIGDSDNDEMMIRECGYGIAVENAFQGTKRAASFVAEGSYGAGVVEGLAWLGLLRS